MNQSALQDRRGRARLWLGVALALVLGGCIPAGAGAALPDGRGYELVSPVAKNGVSPFGAVPSLDGGSVDFQAYGAFAGAGSGSANLYQAVRGAGGWQTTPLTPTPSRPLGALEQQIPLFYSSDLSKTVFTTGQSYAAGDDDEGSLDLYLGAPGGASTWLSQGSEGGAAPDQVTFDGATPDARHVLFSSAESLVPAADGLDETATPEPEYLYDRDSSSGQTDLVNVNSSGELLNTEGAFLGNGRQLTFGAPPAHEFLPADFAGTTTNAVSSDGSKVFFESGRALYMREHDSTTVQIAELGQFEGASADGSLVFFTDFDELTGFETSGGTLVVKQLFVFNTTSQPIGAIPAMSAVSLSAGDLTVPSTTITAEVPEQSNTLPVASTQGFHVGESIQVTSHERYSIESIPDATHLVIDGYLSFGVSYHPGATVEGQPRTASITAVANDGSRVYFVATGVLAENENAAHRTAVDAEPNLYLYDTGTGETTFVATLSAQDGAVEANLVAEPDVKRPAVPSPDGSTLVFASSEDLTGQNPAAEFQEIYRYSANGGSLVCLSCTAGGVAPTGDAGLGETAGGSYHPAGAATAISEDGARVFFQTPDSLVAGDRNGVSDVYEWENGQLSLISGGESAAPAILSGTTPSGDDVFFTTEAGLVGQDTDGGVTDVYDARVGGGFAEQGSVSAPVCAGQGCRAGSAVPPVFGVPDSATSKGVGNLPAPVSKPKAKPKPAACRKGFVKKRVDGKSRCVRKPVKKSKKAKRALNGSSRHASAVVNDHRSL